MTWHQDYEWGDEDEDQYDLTHTDYDEEEYYDDDYWEEYWDNVDWDNNWFPDGAKTPLEHYVKMLGVLWEQVRKKFLPSPDDSSDIPF